MAASPATPFLLLAFSISLINNPVIALRFNENRAQHQQVCLWTFDHTFGSVYSSRTPYTCMFGALQANKDNVKWLGYNGQQGLQLSAPSNSTNSYFHLVSTFPVPHSSISESFLRSQNGVSIELWVRLLERKSTSIFSVGSTNGTNCEDLGFQIELDEEMHVIFRFRQLATSLSGNSLRCFEHRAVSKNIIEECQVPWDSNAILSPITQIITRVHTAKRWPGWVVYFRITYFDMKTFETITCSTVSLLISRKRSESFVNATRTGQFVLSIGRNPRFPENRTKAGIRPSSFAPVIPNFSAAISTATPAEGKRVDYTEAFYKGTREMVLRKPTGKNLPDGLTVPVFTKSKLEYIQSKYSKLKELEAKSEFHGPLYPQLSENIATMALSNDDQLREIEEEKLFANSGVSVYEKSNAENNSFDLALLDWSETTYIPPKQSTFDIFLVAWYNKMLTNEEMNKNYKAFLPSASPFGREVKVVVESDSWNAVRLTHLSSVFKSVNVRLESTPYRGNLYFSEEESDIVTEKTINERLVKNQTVFFKSIPGEYDGNVAIDSPLVSRENLPYTQFRYSIHNSSLNITIPRFHCLVNVFVQERNEPPTIGNETCLRRVHRTALEETNKKCFEIRAHDDKTFWRNLSVVVESLPQYGYLYPSYPNDDRRPWGESVDELRPVGFLEKEMGTVIPTVSFCYEPLFDPEDDGENENERKDEDFFAFRLVDEGGKYSTEKYSFILKFVSNETVDFLSIWLKENTVKIVHLNYNSGVNENLSPGNTVQDLQHEILELPQHGSLHQYAESMSGEDFHVGNRIDFTPFHIPSGEIRVVYVPRNNFFNFDKKNHQFKGQRELFSFRSFSQGVSDGLNRLTKVNVDVENVFHFPTIGYPREFTCEDTTYLKDFNFSLELEDPDRELNRLIKVVIQPNFFSGSSVSLLNTSHDGVSVSISAIHLTLEGSSSQVASALKTLVYSDTLPNAHSSKLKIEISSNDSPNGEIMKDMYTVTINVLGEENMNKRIEQMFEELSCLKLFFVPICGLDMKTVMLLKSLYPLLKAFVSAFGLFFIGCCCCCVGRKYAQHRRQREKNDQRTMVQNDEEYTYMVLKLMRELFKPNTQVAVLCFHCARSKEEEVAFLENMLSFFMEENMVSTLVLNVLFNEVNKIQAHPIPVRTLLHYPSESSTCFLLGLNHIGGSWLRSALIELVFFQKTKRRSISRTSGIMYRRKGVKLPVQGDEKVKIYTILETILMALVRNSPRIPRELCLLCSVAGRYIFSYGEQNGMESSLYEATSLIIMNHFIVPLLKNPCILGLEFNCCDTFSISEVLLAADYIVLLASCDRRLLQHENQPKTLTAAAACRCAHLLRDFVQCVHDCTESGFPPEIQCSGENISTADQMQFIHCMVFEYFARMVDTARGMEPERPFDTLAQSCSWQQWTECDSEDTMVQSLEEINSILSVLGPPKKRIAEYCDGQRHQLWMEIIETGLSFAECGVGI